MRIKSQNQGGYIPHIKPSMVAAPSKHAQALRPPSHGGNFSSSSSGSGSEVCFASLYRQDSDSSIPTGLGKLFSITKDPFFVADLPSIFALAHSVRYLTGSTLTNDWVDSCRERAWLALWSIVWFWGTSWLDILYQNLLMIIELAAIESRIVKKRSVGPHI